MPAPVKATICSHSKIHRAIVLMCCSLVTTVAVERLVVAKTAYQVASLERMRCSFELNIFESPRLTALRTYSHRLLTARRARGAKELKEPLPRKNTTPMYGQLPHSR